jgi:hypothetical protein
MRSSHGEPGSRWREAIWARSSPYRYVVLTMCDGLVVEMKGCADRATALTYVESG